MPLRVIITGGGTGGHLFPALAVAEQLIETAPDSEILFVGAGRYIDVQALKGRGFARKTIRCGGLKGGSLLSKLQSIANLPIGLGQSLLIIKRFKPHLVFGVGGYVTGPVLAAAKILGVPACIHEQNSVPGMANRQIGKFANRIFLSIPGSERYFPAGKCLLSGNPVRQDFLQIRKSNSKIAKGVADDSLSLLVIGGSQGAHALNCMLPEAISLLKKSFAGKVRVVHQTGRQDEAMVLSAYERLGVSHTVKDFFENMAEQINQADLVICRAGATTLAELMILRKPAILVPYPYAADDHQAKNADFLVKGGAAKMFRQEDLDKGKLANEISTLLANPAKMQEMGARADRLAQPEAARFIVDECLKIIKEAKN